jgi:hypothetical protein
MPVAAEADFVKPVEVPLLMLLEIAREMKQRLLKEAGLAQHQGDEQPAGATVAITEWVDGFENSGTMCALGDSPFHFEPRNEIAGTLIARNAIADFPTASPLG